MLFVFVDHLPLARYPKNTSIDFVKFHYDLLFINLIIQGALVSAIEV